MMEVRIYSKEAGVDITVPMGVGPATITGGLGGYEVIERQDDVGMTDWSKQSPLTQDVPLLLNGYETDEPVGERWDTIKKLGRDAPGDERRPPVFRVEGPVEYSGKRWVLPDNGIDPNPDSVIRREDDGALMRVEFTLHLLEYVRPRAVRLRRLTNGGNGPSGGARTLSHTVSKGETLISIAAHVLGDQKFWKELGKKNDITDPNRELSAGRVLKL